MLASPSVVTVTEDGYTELEAAVVEPIATAALEAVR